MHIFGASTLDSSSQITKHQFLPIHQKITARESIPLWVWKQLSETQIAREIIEIQEKKFMF